MLLSAPVRPFVCMHVFSLPVMGHNYPFNLSPAPMGGGGGTADGGATGREKEKVRMELLRYGRAVEYTAETRGKYA